MSVSRWAHIRISLLLSLTERPDEGEIRTSSDSPARGDAAFEVIQIIGTLFAFALFTASIISLVFPEGKTAITRSFSVSIVAEKSVDLIINVIKFKM